MEEIKEEYKKMKTLNVIEHLVTDIIRNEYKETHRAVRVIFALSKIPLEYLIQMHSVNDHKGCLEIIWDNEPSTEAKNICRSEWYDLNECNIEHEVLDEYNRVYPPEHFEYIK